MGEWKFSSTVVNLCTRWRWTACYMSLIHYPWNSLVGRLGGPRSRSGRYGGRETSHLSGLDPRFYGRPTSSLITILSCPGHWVKIMSIIKAPYKRFPRLEAIMLRHAQDLQVIVPVSFLWVHCCHFLCCTLCVSKHLAGAACWYTRAECRFSSCRS
jgi:hypothetical protein